MEILIAYLLGLFAGGAFDNDKIKVVGVGCNSIIKNIRQEQFETILHSGLIIVFVLSALTAGLVALDKVYKRSDYY